MSEDLDRERAALLTHDRARNASAADLSDLDLEAVTAGKEDSPQGRRDLAAGGGLSAGSQSWISWAAFKQYSYELWGEYGLAGRRRQGWGRPALPYNRISVSMAV